MNSPSRRNALFVGSDRASAEKLHRANSAWAVRVLPNAAQAFAELAREGHQIDAVVSDVNLGGETANGNFLRELGAKHPHLARVGVAAANGANRASRPPSFSVVSRGCDARALETMLDRTFNLQRLIGGAQVRSVVGRLDRLPSVPQTYWALMEASQSETSDLADIARIISTDAAMSLKVLQLVNSAFFGAAQRITSIQQAVTRLGLELLKGLVLTAHVFCAFEHGVTPCFSLEHFQRYSVQVAQLARRFLPDAELAEEAFTGGLLHDIGKLILALREPARFAEITARVADTGEAVSLVEREVLGVSHAEVGAYLLFTWGIPFSIVEAIAYHHEPGAVASGGVEVLAAIHAADALVGIVSCGEPEDRLDRAFIERAGFADALPRWRQLVEDARDA